MDIKEFKNKIFSQILSFQKKRKENISVQMPASSVNIFGTNPTLVENPEFDTNIKMRRILAGILDFILLLIVYFIFIMFFGYVNSSTNLNIVLNGFPLTFFILFFFLYYIISEYLSGKTIGKIFLNIKVLGINGANITFKQSVERNLTRVIDGFPFFIPYVLGAFLMFREEKQQRFGDILADTIVAREKI